MTQLSQPRRTRILQTTVTPEELHHRKAQRRELGMQCRAIFERIRPQLIENHYNWFIAIDADNENYLLDLKDENIKLRLCKRKKLTILNSSPPHLRNKP